MDNYKKLSKYIDHLNEEKMPKEHKENSSDEFERLLDTVRKVRTLKEPGYPEKDYSDRLVSSINRGTAFTYKKRQP